MLALKLSLSGVNCISPVPAAVSYMPMSSLSLRGCQMQERRQACLAAIVLSKVLLHRMRVGHLKTRSKQMQLASVEQLFTCDFYLQHH